ncbi:MAG TPA: hypothetical protein VJK90_08175, partial [Acetobacteraceae bacterium]|nr:hypothetical protein [Acetobacteraceae bacterium]
MSDPPTTNPASGPPGGPPSGTASPHPVATVHARGRRFSLIWAIPVVTALIGGWLAWDTLARRGPL